MSELIKPLQILRRPGVKDSSLLENNTAEQHRQRLQQPTFSGRTVPDPAPTESGRGRNSQMKP